MLSTLFKNKVVASSFWMVIEKLTKLIVGVFVSGLIARHLAPEGFGQLNYALALLSVAITFSSLGLNRIAVRYFVEKVSSPTTRIAGARAVICMRFIASIATFLLLLFIAFSYLDDDILFYFIVFLSLIFTPFDVVDLYQQALSDVKTISILRFIAMLLSAVLKIYLVISDQSLVFFALAVLVEYVLIAFLLAIFFKIQHKNSLLKFESSFLYQAKDFLAESWPEILAGLGAMMFMRLDQIMIHAILGAESVGVYSAAVRLSEAWYFLPTALVAASFPFIIKGKSHSHACYIARLRLLLTVLLLISVAAALLVSVLSTWVIDIIYGEQYADSAIILLIHCWSGVFVCMGIGSGSALAAEKKLRWNLYRNAFGLLVNVLLNFVLIDYFGVQGAAVATLISLFCAFWLFDLFFPTLRYMFLLKLKTINLFYLFNVRQLKKAFAGF